MRRPRAETNDAPPSYSSSQAQPLLVSGPTVTRHSNWDSCHTYSTFPPPTSGTSLPAQPSVHFSHRYVDEVGFVALPDDAVTEGSLKKKSCNYCSVIPLAVLLSVVAGLAISLFVYPRLLNITVENVSVDPLKGLKLELAPPSIEIPLIMDVEVFNPLFIDLTNVNVTVFGYYPHFQPPVPIGHGTLKSTPNASLSFPSHKTVKFRFPFSLNLPDENPPPHLIKRNHPYKGIRAGIIEQHNDGHSQPGLLAIVTQLVDDCYKKGNFTLNFRVEMAANSKFWHSGGAIRKAKGVVVACGSS